MHSLILIGVLVVLTSAAPLSKEEFDRLEAKYNVTAFIGRKYNLTVAMDILTEEAKTVGVTTEEHLKTCIALDREMSKFNEAWAEFQAKYASLRFDNADQIMDVLKKETPKVHEALNGFRPVYLSMMRSVDKNADAFMEEAKNTAVQTFIDYYNVEEEDETRKLREQIFDSYDALSVESKNSIDRETCSRTIDRIMRTEDRSLVDQLRRDVEEKLRDAKRIEEIEKYLKTLESK